MELLGLLPRKKLSIDTVAPEAKPDCTGKEGGLRSLDRASATAQTGSGEAETLQSTFAEPLIQNVCHSVRGRSAER